MSITKRQRAREMMFEGKSVADIARELECHYTTVHRWRRDPVFAAKLEALQDARLTMIADRQKALVAKALDKFEKLLDDPDCPHATLLKAITEAFDRGGAASGAQTVVLQPIKVDADMEAAAERWLAGKKKPDVGG